MRTRTVILALAGALAVAACREHGNEAGDRTSATTEQITGTVARVDETRLVIRPPDRPEVTLRVTDRTSVTVDGRPASPARLLEGTEVRASYSTENGGRPTAVAIEAQSPIERNGTTGGAKERTRSGAHGGTGSSPAGSGPSTSGPEQPAQPVGGRRP
jgi:hypothetical protein